jgi:multidrug resistance protein
LSDVAGRRPAYLICFVIYLAANIGLALQTNYAALFILRCVQSSGSSGTVTLAIGVVADIATTAERGRYIGYATAGILLGPAFGPLIGGVLTQYLGWRSIFWFLTIVAGIVTLIFLIFFPETCRAIVGNGSIKPSGWNMSVINYHQVRQQRKGEKPTQPFQGCKSNAKLRMNPFSSLQILFEKEGGIVLLFSALLFAGFYGVVSAIPSQFAIIYGFDDLQIGLCYIPVGMGSMFAALIQGRLVDWNFRRHATRLGMPITKGRQQVISNFPIEAARLQLAIPFLYISCVLITAFGWSINYNAPLAVPLVLLFFTAYSLSGTFNVLSTLIVDLHPGKAGAATAANNLARCLTGAGFTAAVLPMIDRLGRGWTYTLLAFVWLAVSPLLFVVIKCGPGWREARRVREEKAGERDARPSVANVASK